MIWLFTEWGYLLAVALNLVNLYVSPTILSAVERRVSAGELFATIAGFAFVLMLVSAASAYVNTNTLFGRVSVRSEIMNLLNRKEQPHLIPMQMMTNL